MSTSRPMSGLRPTRSAVSRGFVTLLAALVLLVGLSFLVAPSSLAPGAVSGMLPFASVLAIIGLGQMLVVQQTGIDLSVPGSVSITVVIVTHVPYGSNDRLGVALLLVLAVAIATGLLNAAMIGLLNLSPIIATLGSNALLFGAILGISGGVPRSTTPALAQAMGGSLVGVPNSVMIAIGALLLVVVVLKTTVPGRRFEAVGATVRMTRALGVATRAYRGGAYVGSQLLYAIAGVVLAGVVAQPTAYLGNNYLLPSVAVVVLAGTSLLGGRGFPVATAIAALFLTQLDQFTLALGVPYAAQTLVQALAFAVGVAIYTIDWAAVRRRFMKAGGVPPSVPATH
ncbi:ABC transporter permease [Micromonospora sp. NPDC048830]|uniref:ABC transporter permease n=1 Tax=Micromonospora sp. NPDC048830 TaxID=3364257 RepID=UPI003723EB82